MLAMPGRHRGTVTPSPAVIDDLIVIINDATCMELSAPAQLVMHAHALIAAVDPLKFASGSGADLLVDFILPPLGLNI